MLENKSFSSYPWNGSHTHTTCLILSGGPPHFSHLMEELYIWWPLLRTRLSIMPHEQSDIQVIAQAIQTLNTTGQSISSFQAASLKLPEFWTVKLKVWFAMVESQFNSMGIVQAQDNSTSLWFVFSTQLLVKQKPFSVTLQNQTGMGPSRALCSWPLPRPWL